MERLNRGSCRRGFTLIELMIVIAIISVIMLIVMPNMVRSRNLAKYASCKSNLRSMASAMESYATDHNGAYPQRLSDLTENGVNGTAYISVPLTCPVTGTAESYNSGYQVSTDPVNSYTLICSGSNHLSAGAPAGYPQYSASSGIIEPTK